MVSRRRRRMRNSSANTRSNRARRRNNIKVVSLRRRPRRNVPLRVPTLGYAAGGTSTTFRAFLEDFTVLANKSKLSTCYTFDLQTALSKADSYLKVLTTVYTNFQIQQVTFRILSLVGSNTGGVHSALILDKSMSFPVCNVMSYADVVSRGGSTTGKLYTNLALDWVPTEPNDLNFKGIADQEMQLMYSVELPAPVTSNTIVSKLMADIRCVARTINPATPSKEACKLLGLSGSSADNDDAE